MRDLVLQIINGVLWIFFAYFLVTSIAIILKCSWYLYTSILTFDYSEGTAKDILLKTAALTILPLTTIFFYMLANWKF